MECKQRLYLTADKAKLVAEGDKEAATLYASPGDEIPEKAAELFGLVDGALPGRKAKFAEVKDGTAPPNKEAPPPADKGGTKPKDKAAVKKAATPDPIAPPAAAGEGENA